MIIFKGLEIDPIILIKYLRSQIVTSREESLRLRFGILEKGGFLQNE